MFQPFGTKYRMKGGVFKHDKRDTINMSGGGACHSSSKISPKKYNFSADDSDSGAVSDSDRDVSVSEFEVKIPTTFDVDEEGKIPPDKKQAWAKGSGIRNSRPIFPDVPPPPRQAFEDDDIKDEGQDSYDGADDDEVGQSESEQKEQEPEEFKDEDEWDSQPEWLSLTPSQRRKMAADRQKYIDVGRAILRNNRDIQDLLSITRTLTGDELEAHAAFIKNQLMVPDSVDLMELISERTRYNSELLADIKRVTAYNRNVKWGDKKAVLDPKFSVYRGGTPRYHRLGGHIVTAVRTMLQRLRESRESIRDREGLSGG